ncbi:hypothetical protein ABG067_002425 [Albugo candida]
MGQHASHELPPHGNGAFYVGPVYATSLSYDRETEVRIGSGGGNGILDVKSVQIGSRGHLLLLDTSKKFDFFKRLGIMVKTQGSRIMQNAEIVIVDYYRLQGRRLVARNRGQGPSLSNWNGMKGPAEASGGLRIGDTLYAINHRLVVNKSRGQVSRQIHSLLAKCDGNPIILTWKHTEEVNELPWELEDPMPPPEGTYVQVENEWGSALPTKISSVSI